MQDLICRATRLGCVLQRMRKRWCVRGVVCVGFSVDYLHELWGRRRNNTGL